MKVSLGGVHPGDGFPHSGSTGNTQRMAVPKGQRLSGHGAAQDGDNKGTVLPGEQGSLRGWWSPGNENPQGMVVSSTLWDEGTQNMEESDTWGCWWVSPQTLMDPWTSCCPWSPQACGPQSPHRSPGPCVTLGPSSAWLAVPAWRGGSSVTAPPSLPACSVHFILSKHGTATAPCKRLPAIRLWPSSPAPSPWGSAISTPRHVPRSPCPRLPGSPHPSGETEAGLEFACGPSGGWTGTSHSCHQLPIPREVSPVPPQISLHCPSRVGIPCPVADPDPGGFGI